MRDRDEAVGEGWSIADVVRRVVAGRKTLIVAFVALGLLLSTAYADQAAPTYQASAELVTGTYSMSSEIGLREAVVGAGPLGLELPAETQARIIASPIVVSIAIGALALGQDEGRELLRSASATANTDHVFTVTASGRTPEDSVERANALAASYLTYRNARATEMLEPLQVEARENAERSDAAAAELQPRIAKAEVEDSVLAATLTDAQQQHRREANAEAARETAIGTALETFDGGGTVVRPADVANVSGGTSRGRWLAVGGLGGLLLGLAGALLIERLRSPVRSRDDVLAVSPTAIALERSGATDIPVVAARHLLRQAPARNVRGPWQVSVVPARSGSDVEETCYWLASGFQALSQTAHVTIDVVPAETAGVDVALTGYPDVPTLCVAAGRAHDGEDEVVVTVTRGVDTTTSLRATLADLEGAGLSVLAVALVPRPRRWRKRLLAALQRSNRSEPTEAVAADETETPLGADDDVPVARTGATPDEVANEPSGTTRPAPDRPFPRGTKEDDDRLVKPGVSRDASDSR